MATPPTALVLSGAGTKGAFEVGALQYLIAEQGLQPDIITATSAGAILGTILAQARTHDEFVARIDEIRGDLLAMTRTDVVFAKQPWLAAFDGQPLGDAVDAFITVRNRPAVPPDPDAPDDAADPGDSSLPSDRRATAKRHKHRGWQSFVSVLEQLPAARKAKGELKGHVGSLLLLDPLEAALRGRSDTGIDAIDPSLVARPGLQLRLAVTALTAGHTRYVTEDARIVDADAQTAIDPQPPDGFDVIDGLLASSTVPMVFEPRPIGDDVYVDGGVLQNIPVEAAVRLGARHIVAVLGVPLEPRPDERDFTDVNFIGIYLRAVGAIGFADRQRTNLAVPLPEDATLTVVEPTVDVVGPFEVAQGLMLLDMDYGWLRAAETTADLSPTDRAVARQSSDAVTAARERAWYLEEQLWEAGGATDDELARVRDTKRQVQRALSRRSTIDVPAPAGLERWWLDYEHHAADRPEALPADLWEPVGGFAAGS